MSISKLQFIIDQKYDARMIFESLRRLTTKKIKNQAQAMGLSNSLAIKIRKDNWNIARRSILTEVDFRYKLIGNKLQKTRQLYQLSWNEINDKFFSLIERTTGYPWSYPRFKCVVSVFHKGISNWNGNVIARIWSENPYTMCKITAHELIISHIFSIFTNYKNKFQKVNQKQIWAIAEVTAWCLTGLEPDIVKLWPWVTEQQKFPLKHNYPELYSIQPRIKKIYTNENNFQSFLNESIHIVKNSNLKYLE